MVSTKLKHDPIVPARKGHIGEQVFSSMWAAAMAEMWDEGCFNGDEEPPICLVLYEMDEIDQRAATVAATFVCWLGCNMGHALMMRAEAERAAGRWDENRCYFLAWQVENRRVRCVNSGVRLVEYMLTPPEDRKPQADIADTGLKRLPVLSAVDLEVIDHVTLWLPTERGQAFLRQCYAEMARLNDEERRRQVAEWNRSLNV